MLTLGIYGAFALVAATCLIWLKNDLGLWDTIIFFGVGVFFAHASLRAVGQLRSPKPLFRVDEIGIEGSFGRIPWKNVERISIEYRWMDTMRVVSLYLRSGSPDLEETQQDYASEWLVGGSLVTSNRLDIPVWGYKNKMVRDLRPFYGGHIET
jgi:hypothetical protein